LAILKRESHGASQAISGKCVPGVAVVTDCNANIFCVEERSISACEAGLIAVKSFAERISSWDEGVGISDALALVDYVASVASCAISSLFVPVSAVIGNWCAYSIGVGEESD